MKRLRCFMKHKLVPQLVMMAWGSVNRFVEMLLYFQYFNLFVIKMIRFFFQLKKIPESKTDQKQLRTEFQKFHSRK